MKICKTRPKSFLLAFLMNLLLQGEWLLVAIVMLILHCWIGIPLWLVWAALGLWGVIALVVTWFVTWAAGCSDTNPGPGAKRTSERIRARECGDATAEK